MLLICCYYVCLYCFQCELLLNIMGVTCVYSPGEAEQLCAILNKNGVCITDHVDVVLLINLY